MKHINIKRYGKLIPTNQEGNYGKDGFHNAPEKLGFYCFDRRYFEPFLVGDKMFQRDVYYGKITGGYLWVHNEPPEPNMIIQRHNSWFKIRAEDYHKIFNNNYYNSVFSVEYDMKYAKDSLELFCTSETKITHVRKGFNKQKHRGAEKDSEWWDINDQKETSRYDYYNELRNKET